MKTGVGSVVMATAGRGKGRHFIVVAVVDGDYVRISDGETRPQERAKLKKLKHLKLSGEAPRKITEKLAAGKQVYDAELRSALKPFNTEPEDVKCQKTT